MSPWNAEYTTEGTRGAVLSDPIDSFLPSMFIAKESISSGEIPLWNPKISFGEPFDITSFFYPLRWVYLFLPLNIAPTIELILQMLLTQIGMYLALRSLKLRTMPAIFGAITFACSLPMIVWANWPHTSVGMLAPWLFWSVNGLFTKKAQYLIATPLILFWMITVGMPAYAVYFLYIVSFYFVSKTIYNAYRKKDCVMILKWFAAYGGLVSLSLLMAMPYILSFLKISDFTGYVDRRINGSIFENTRLHINYIMLLFDTKYRETAGLSQHPNEILSYCGILAMFLSICILASLSWLKNKTLLFFIAVAVILGGAIYGLPLFNIVGMLPLLNTSPSLRLVMPLCFCFAFIASYGMERSTEILSDKKLLFGFLFRGVVIIALFYVSFYIFVSRSYFSIGTVFGIGVIGVFLFVSLSYHILRVKKIIVIAVLLCLSFFDLYIAGARYNPSVIYTKSSLAPSTQITEYLKSETLSNSRIAKFAGSGSTFVLFPNSYVFYNLLDLNLHSLITTNVRLTNYLKGISEDVYLSPTRTSLGEISEMNLVNFSGASQIVSENFEDMKADVTLNNLQVHHNDTALPRAYLTGQYEIASGDEILELMKNTDNLNVAYLEEIPGFPSYKDELQDVDLLEITNNTVTVKTSASDDKLLVLSDLWYPGWNAYLDGKQIDIFRANYIFRGVRVPPSEHTVKMIYCPIEFYIGICLHVLGIIILIALAIFMVSKRKKALRASSSSFI
jgi:hypothetical protein